MRSPLNDKARLEHIQNAINTIEEYVAGKVFEDIVTDKILRHAVTWNIQVIGEASNKLSKEFIVAHPNTNWRGVIGMRHVLVHDYYQIDEEGIWNVIIVDLPPLKAQIEQYLSEMK
jgi:uncharacterized protein with HEPN domain